LRQLRLNEVNADSKGRCDVFHVKNFVWCTVLLQIVGSDLGESPIIVEEIVPSAVSLDLINILLHGLPATVHKAIKNVGSLWVALEQGQNR